MYFIVQTILHANFVFIRDDLFSLFWKKVLFFYETRQKLKTHFLHNRPYACRPHDVFDWIVVLNLAWTCGFVACKCSALSKKLIFLHNRPHACRSHVLCYFLLLFVILIVCLFGESHTTCTIVYLLMEKVTQHVHVSD